MDKPLFHETLERIAPRQINEEDIFAQRTLELHLQRYYFATRHIVPGRVLDMACGTGYGTDILAEAPLVITVTGIDLSEDAINYANKTYANHKINFIQKDFFSFSDDKLFDTIVSLETIEHIYNPARGVQHLLSLLKPGGRLIISAPVTPSMDGNPYHLSDFSSRSFKTFFKHPSLKIIEELKQIQSYTLNDVLGSKKINRLKRNERSLLQFYFKHPGKFFKRIQSLMSDGLNNKYLTLVVEKSI
jgi:2-polyprenyl-3-methyl-5-hydroxy-6-metoxy-1,4-benzoquinol methylase